MPVIQELVTGKRTYVLPYRRYKKIKTTVVAKFGLSEAIASRGISVLPAIIGLADIANVPFQGSWQVDDKTAWNLAFKKAQAYLTKKAKDSATVEDERTSLLDTYDRDDSDQLPAPEAWFGQDERVPEEQEVRQFPNIEPEDSVVSVDEDDETDPSDIGPNTYSVRNRGVEVAVDPVFFLTGSKVFIDLERRNFPLKGNVLVLKPMNDGTPLFALLVVKFKQRGVLAWEVGVSTEVAEPQVAIEITTTTRRLGIENPLIQKAARRVLKAAFPILGGISQALF